MGTFVGFTREHFEYFVFNDAEDAKVRIHADMKQFAADVLADLRAVEPFYADVDFPPPKLGEPYWWMGLGPGDQQYRNVTHQAISIAVKGLKVAVNSELKPATERVKRLVARDGIALFDALIKLYGIEPFQIRLWERKKRHGQLYDYVPEFRLYSPMLDDPRIREVAWNALSTSIREMPLFQLNIRRILKPAELVRKSGEAAVKLVVEMMKENHAVVKLLNDDA